MLNMADTDTQSDTDDLFHGGDSDVGDSASQRSTSTSPETNRKKSDVWKYFQKAGPKRVSCQLCSKQMAYHGGTTNLRDHLIRIHPKDYNLQHSSATSTSTTLDGFLSKSKCPPSRSRHITELITDMVARDLRPAAIVKGEGFCALLNYIEPGYKIPSDTHIASVIRQKHEVGKRAMMQRLKNENAFTAFTSDIWTSCANDAYISLTAHFIDSDWQLVSCVLGSSPFPGHHTGSHIYEKLKDITHAFGFQQHSQLVALVHDAASNMVLSGEILEERLECASVCCAAHRLQLCIEDGLSVSAISRAVGAAKKLVTHFRHSALASDALKKKQLDMGKPVMKLQQDCPTRWNSTFYMIRSLLENRWPVTAVLSDETITKRQYRYLYMIRSLLENRWPVTAVLSDETITKRQYRYLDLTSENWLLLEDLFKVLEPLEIATVVFSSESHISLSVVLPVVYSIISQLSSSDNTTESIAIRVFKEKVVAGMKTRWKLDEIDANLLLATATALDPRFKHLKFLTEVEQSKVKEYIIERAKYIQLHCATPEAVPCNEIPPQKKSKSALDILLGEEASELEINHSNNIETDLSLFYTEKVISRDSDPILWWQQNHTRFPILSQVAKYVLCVPATSTSSERLFSTAGLTVSKLRSCLKPDNVDALTFLHANYHYLKNVCN
ncbi:PREDICTED: zinc finger BED domain-containing protein 1-like [Amphimedon queenslandica]|uniref:BED-type domain-containing protein n=1 Tax=Amphimedon queenslandica TaxID=400682 RepID=A0AAN0J4Q8_AMPQE|nr:PREDICTED: zinc finger BED domain-containing protein 1-like [Amphimedon queenslandica]|eukprot:XP_019851990.1 PREDICTED: zinc finger BED domain-containing protein 1-like [Amphimedon queenslandica]